MNYKVGDKVRIIKRTRCSGDYPFDFVNDMADKAGNIYEIEKFFESGDNRCKINGDFHKYYLKGDFYSWHSSMFEPAEQKLYNLSEEESIKIVL